MFTEYFYSYKEYHYHLDDPGGNNEHCPLDLVRWYLLLIQKWKNCPSPPNIMARNILSNHITKRLQRSFLLRFVISNKQEYNDV